MTPAAFQRTAADIVAEILMVRAAFSGAIVLVEGPTDSRFIRRYIIPGSAQITICGGKANVLGSIAQLPSAGVVGYLGFVDRDFDDRLGILRSTPLYVTDTHDVETLMLSQRLETVVTELADPLKIEARRQSTGKPLLEELLDRGEIFGRIRYLNEVDPRLGANMENMSPWKYSDVTTWYVDEDALTADFATKCGYTVAAVVTMRLAVPRLRSWLDVRGHDMLAIMSIGLRQVLGTGRQISEENLSSALRLAFTEADFQQTQLYLALKAWESATGLSFLTC